MHEVCFICNMILQTGDYNTLRIEEETPDAFMMEGNITLPKDRQSSRLRIGDSVTVFLYHNTKMELVATLLKPKGKVGDLVTLKVIELTPAGAFLDWGLPKDILLPRSYHEDDLKVGDFCLVKILLDTHTGRVIAKEKLEDEISNETLTVIEKDVVQMIVYKNTDIGYQMIINGKHLGILHYNEVFKELFAGDVVTGFVKKIKEENKIDVMIGKPGHARVMDETDTILDAIKSAGGFLPYHDKTPADEIYRVFGMSKKTFKMTIGTLYKRKLIKIEETGIRLSGS